MKQLMTRAAAAFLLVAASVALARFEVSTAKMRVFRVPEYLGVTMLLGILSGIFLFVASRLGG